MMEELVSVDNVCLIPWSVYAASLDMHFVQFVPLFWRLDVFAGSLGSREETLTRSRGRGSAELAVLATWHARRSPRNPYEVAHREGPLGPIVSLVSTYPSLWAAL